MTHLNDDQLFSLAEHTDEMLPYTKEENEMMEHLKTCETCYDKFCAALALAEIASPAGYAVLGSIFDFSALEKGKKPFGEKVLAVVQFVRRKLEDASEIIAEPVRQLSGLLTFTPAPLAAARGGGQKNQILRMEDTENGDTFILFDPAERQLLIQVSVDALEGQSPQALIRMEDGTVLPIPMKQTENVFTGILENVPEGDFNVEMTVC